MSAPFMRGEFVQTQFDTGAFGYSALLGIVERAGTKQFTVRWESDIRNRLPQGHHEVTRVTDPELVAMCERKFAVQESK